MQVSLLLYLNPSAGALCSKHLAAGLAEVLAAEAAVVHPAPLRLLRRQARHLSPSFEHRITGAHCH